MRFFTTCLTFILICIFSPLVYGQDPVIQLNCTAADKIPILGEDLATTGFHTVDIDNDGVLELIFGGSSDYQGINFWENNYIIVLSYIDEPPFYRIEAQSDFYFEETILGIRIFDRDGDGTDEIAVNLDSGKMQFFHYDGNQFLLQDEVQIPSSSRLFEFGDVDNDGAPEIVVRNNFGDAVLLNPMTFEEEGFIDLSFGNNLLIGDVDGDNLVEFISSNTVYQLENDVLTEEWTDFTINSTIAQLVDIDGDGILEIVGPIQPGLGFIAYDADVQAVKYEFDIPSMIDYFVTADIDGDGFSEIITGDQGSEGIICYDGASQNQLWTLANHDTRVEGMAVKDFDGDGATELIHVAGSGSTGPDRVVWHDVTTQEFEQETPWAANGSFDNYALYDIDEDGEEEIIYLQRITQGQEVFPQSYNVFSIVNADTKELEYQSPIDAPFASDFLIDYSITVGDVDDDGDLEILMGLRGFNGPEIWILDYETFTHQATYVLSDQDGFVSDLQLLDIDGDGATEIIAATGTDVSGNQEGNLYILDGADGQIDYDSGLVGGTGFTNRLNFLHIEDLDADGNLEIIIRGSKIKVWDWEVGTIWESEFVFSKAIEVQNVDDDPQLEIIYYGGLIGPKKLTVLDGLTKEEEASYDMGDDNIDGIFTPVSGIVAEDVNENGLMEYFLLSGGKMYYFENPDFIYSTPALSNVAGSNDGIIIRKNSNDESTILLNGTQAIMEINYSCIACTTFSAEVNAENPSCQGMNDGLAAAIPVGGSGSYAYAWNTGATDSLIVGLSAGDYAVTILDDTGCVAEQNFTLVQPNLTATLETTAISCTDTLSGEISVNISEGLAPYAYLWSNGSQESELDSLPAGTYSLTLTDANNCEWIETTTLSESVLEISATQLQPDCNNTNNGIATVNVDVGQAPYQFEWSTGMDNQELTSLPSGNYEVTVTDNLGCVNIDSIFIDSAAFSINTLVSPACIDSVFGMGIAQIEVTEGGMMPYSYFWENSLSDSISASLPIGEYTVDVMDGNGCSVQDTFSIDFAPFDWDLDITHVSCNGETDGAAEFTPVDVEAPFEFLWNTGDTTALITDLPADSYLVTISNSNCTHVYFFDIQEPDPIGIEFDSGADISSTPNPDGFATAIPSGGIFPYTYLWSTGDETATILNLEMGEYTVTITDANGCENSETVVIDFLDAVSNLPLNQLATVAPNPFSGQLFIQTTTKISSSWHWTMHNLLGQSIPITDIINESTNTVELTVRNMPSGLYLLMAWEENRKIGQWRVVYLEN